jgi:hypothetical protein
MILVYIEVPVDQWTTTDAHYFPEANVSVTRVSEPKNYFGSGRRRVARFSAPRCPAPSAIGCGA